MIDLLGSKHDTAIEALRRLGIGAWLLFVRETSIGGDPALAMVYDGNLTWPSALLLCASGERIAIVGKLDDGPVRACGLFSEVIAYTEGIQADLLALLRRVDPASIAINFAPDDVLADGLSHGMRLRLEALLEGTPFATRLISAAAICAAVRGRKSREEIARIERAIAAGDAIYAEVPEICRAGVSELAIQRAFQQRARENDWALAWERAMCPIVNIGAGSMMGHALPSDDVLLEPGQLLHLDFGVRVDGYCSDIQRCWYTVASDGDAIPDEVQRAFDAVVASIEAAKAALRPGVACWQVDAAARQVLVDAGYPAYPHATGHEVGQWAHDGGGVLGPRWPRYGAAPEKVIEVGNVFTIEPSIAEVSGRGTIGVEEMVVVAPDGARWLSRPQTELWKLPLA